MQHLFLDCEQSLDQVAFRIFEAAASVNGVEIDSMNVLGGTYFEGTFRNLVLRVESNSYEYEDDYEFMITLKSNVLGDGQVTEKELQMAAKALQSLLVDKLRIPVAMELDSSLELMEPTGN
jgi:hypothetical protein